MANEVFKFKLGKFKGGRLRPGMVDRPKLLKFGVVIVVTGEDKFKLDKEGKFIDI